ncbi:MAG: hypothetical protein M3M99_03195, partial [Actinomycetota bacterium]|nr:hypothetical protein [Actinomycetota bacterium]
DPLGASDTDEASIQAGNTAPSASITAPAAGLVWAVDDVVGFSGSATDAQQTLPASAFDWELIINHCPSNCHQHSVQQFPDRTSGSFSAPDHEYPSSLLIRLTVTDSGGLTDTESVTIDPRTVNLTLNSLPGGLQLGLNGGTATAPFTRSVIEGSQNTVIAPTPQSLGGGAYAFGSWSDSGAASHNVTADQSKTLTATYDETAPPDPPPPDTTPPDTTITNGPAPKVKLPRRKRAAKRAKKAALTFEFTATEPGAGFECRLDDDPYAPCVSPLAGEVKRGSHIFLVRAMDQAGNVDASPASRAFEVVKKKKKRGAQFAWRAFWAAPLR